MSDRIREYAGDTNRPCKPELYRQTRDLRLVQTVLVHSSPQVTQLYAHLSGADVEEALRQFQQ